MHLFADKPLPKPENDAPDWTYEALIDDLVTQHAAYLYQKHQKQLSVGLYPQFPVTLFVEDRSATRLFSSAEPQNDGKNALPDRFWRLDEAGFVETDRTEYEKVLCEFESDERLAATYSVSVLTFRFEANYQHIIWQSYGFLHKTFSATKNRIYRRDDGRMTFDYLSTLGIS